MPRGQYERNHGQRECDRCGKEFTKQLPTQKFCSPACRIAARQGVEAAQRIIADIRKFADDQERALSRV